MHDFLIHSPLTRFAKHTPDKAAFSYSGAELTYAELDEASNQLAHALADQGLAKHDRVGIFMHKGLDLPVAIYGILKAGAVFVPLDATAPPERLSFMIRDCGIAHLISNDDCNAVLCQIDAPHPLSLYGVSKDTPHTGISWADIRSYPRDPIVLQLIDQDLGYIMYTSGSTGEPKGMMHTHHGSITYANWGARHVGLSANDRVASHAPLHFDLSIFDFFSTLRVGGTVVLVPEAITKFPASWTQYIQSERISVVFTVPYTLIDMLQRGAMDKRDLSSLRWILFGGEPFPPKHLRSLMAAIPDVRFTNVYGPAEAPSCTCYDIPTDEPLSDEPIPIGRVSANSADLIVDGQDVECATGQEGELCIRSSTLTRGYWNRPDLNANVFLHRDSFGPFPARYFRTGDLVVRHSDGLMRFRGRKDRLVKTRGHRVELDEVEAAMTAHPGIVEAAAFAIPDAQGSKTIFAAVIIDSANPVDLTTIFRHTRAKLPTYAVPAEIKITTAFPRTSGGKVDRRQLAAQYQSEHQQ